MATFDDGIRLTATMVVQIIEEQRKKNQTMISHKSGFGWMRSSTGDKSRLAFDKTRPTATEYDKLRLMATFDARMRQTATCQCK